MDEPIRLVGAHEVRELLGVSRQRVYQLAARSDFPAPVATLAQGKLWLLGDIERWLATRRLRPDRARPTSFEEEVQALRGGPEGLTGEEIGGGERLVASA